MALYESKEVILKPREHALCLVGKCSTRKSASALIYTGPCYLLGVKGRTDKANDVLLTIYDNTEASGTIYDEVPIPGADQHGGIIYPAPMSMANGIYVASAGGTHYFVVYYAEILT